MAGARAVVFRGQAGCSCGGLPRSSGVTDFCLLASGSKLFSKSVVSLVGVFPGPSGTTVFFSWNSFESSQEVTEFLFLGFGKKKDRISCCFSFSNWEKQTVINLTSKLACASQRNSWTTCFQEPCLFSFEYLVGNDSCFAGPLHICVDAEYHSHIHTLPACDFFILAFTTCQALPIYSLM